MVEPVARGEGERGFYSLRYLSLVAFATIALAVVAWIVQDLQLALAAGVMGLYALHLISIRYILDNQEQHTEALQSQWELLQRLVDPDDPAGCVSYEPGTQPGGVESVIGNGTESMDLLDPRALDGVRPRTGEPQAGGDSGKRGSAGRSWPPLGLPLSTIDSSPDLGIPAGLGMSNLQSPDATAAELTNDDPFAAVEVPIPRHFALGTVALIRQLLSPSEVARVLMEQRRQPDKRFATLAVEMGLLEETQREELLLAQQEGLFTEEEMRQAREDLQQFRETSAKALSHLD